MTMTATQRKALKFLADRNGKGVLNKNGTVTCAGELACQDPDHPRGTAFSSATWLRLVTMECLAPAGVNRLRVTPLGYQVLAPTELARLAP